MGHAALNALCWLPADVSPGPSLCPPLACALPGLDSQRYRGTLGHTQLLSGCRLWSCSASLLGLAGLVFARTLGGSWHFSAGPGRTAPLSPLPSTEAPSTPQSSLCLLGEVRGQGKVWNPLGLAREGRLGWIPGLPDENHWFLGGRGCPMPLLILIIFYFMKQDREVSDLLLFISFQCSKY